MANFEVLKEEMASRFHIGRKSGALLQDAMSYLSAYPGGLSGFVNKLISVGLEENVTSWVRSPYPMALSPRQVRRALGNETITQMAQKLGLPESLTCKMLGFAFPKIIALLTKDHLVRETILKILPVSGGAHPAPQIEDADGLPPNSEALPPERREPTAWIPARRLFVPAASLAITIGLFSYAIVAATQSDRAFYTPLVHEAQSSPETSAQAPDGFAATAGWTKNLAAEFALGGGTGAGLPPAAQISQMAEAIPGPSGAMMLGTLLADHVPQFVVASAAASIPAGIGTRLAAAAPAAPRHETAPRNEEVMASSEAALQSVTIHFPPNSARVPAESRRALRRAAELMKELPPGTMVEVNGYIAKTANAAGDTEFSARRAQAVYRALVEAGVNPAMLRPQGLGSPELAAGEAGTKEGRSSAAARPRPADRRVEFRIVPPSQ